MKTISVLALMMMLGACAPKPLTEQECRTILEKEIGFGTLRMPDEDRADYLKFARKDVEESVTRCVSTQKSSRKYYECLVAAEDPMATGKCVDAENARRR